MTSAKDKNTEVISIDKAFSIVEGNVNAMNSLIEAQEDAIRKLLDPSLGTGSSDIARRYNMLIAKNKQQLEQFRKELESLVEEAKKNKGTPR